MHWARADSALEKYAPKRRKLRRAGCRRPRTDVGDSSQRELAPATIIAFAQEPSSR
ncbi:hypothetical protein PVAP13_5KG499014 [Panicum virgatum]|uniref:Uncharacterized protein n=1 Tax=Panicum virgatum TaxID=38727 RepID=A0A8T0ST41_PANVG|nr:hypothetical protein PVAP13_5KG499014 [Panicum virgatum]